MESDAVGQRHRLRVDACGDVDVRARATGGRGDFAGGERGRDRRKGMGRRAGRGVVAIGGDVQAAFDLPVGTVAVRVGAGGGIFAVGRPRPVVECRQAALAAVAQTAVRVDRIADVQTVRRIGAVHDAARVVRRPTTGETGVAQVGFAAVDAAPAAMRHVDPVRPRLIDERIVDDAVAVVVPAVAGLRNPGAGRQDTIRTGRMAGQLPAGVSMEHPRVKYTPGRHVQPPDSGAQRPSGPQRNPVGQGRAASQSSVHRGSPSRSLQRASGSAPQSASPRHGAHRRAARSTHAPVASTANPSAHSRATQRGAPSSPPGRHSVAVAFGNAPHRRPHPPHASGLA